MKKGDYVETAEGKPGYILSLEGKTHAFVQWLDDTPYDHIRLGALAPLDVAKYVRKVQQLEEALAAIATMARTGRGNATAELSVEDSADALADTLRNIETYCQKQQGKGTGDV